MVTKTRRISVLILTVWALWAGSLGTSSTAAAQATATVTARWTMDVDFSGNTVNAVWSVYVGNYQKGATPEFTILKSKIQKIACIPHGAFKVVNNEAIFDGQSYLECPLPSFYDTALTLAEEYSKALAFTFKDQCTCMAPRPWVAADVTLSPSSTPNPLLHEISGALQFYTPLLATSGDPLASSNLLLNGVLVKQALTWPVSPKGNRLWSGSGINWFLSLGSQSWANVLAPGFYQTAKTMTTEQFLHWENLVQPVTFDLKTNFTMTNLQTTFLIGHDGRSYFVGTVRKLSWDPGCTPAN